MNMNMISTPEKLTKWDSRFLALANTVAEWSKDHSTKVGAIAVSKRNAILETGFNGFPRGVSDDVAERFDRPAKYTWTAHGEENLIAHAAGHTLHGRSVYITHVNSIADIRMLINAGVSKIVVAGGMAGRSISALTSFELCVAKTMCAEASIKVEAALSVTDFKVSGQDIVVDAAKNYLNGCMAYTTHACCLPCAELLIKANVHKVVIGTGRVKRMEQTQFIKADKIMRAASVDLIYA